MESSVTESDRVGCLAGGENGGIKDSDFFCLLHPLSRAASLFGICTPPREKPPARPPKTSMPRDSNASFDWADIGRFGLSLRKYRACSAEPRDLFVFRRAAWSTRHPFSRWDLGRTTTCIVINICYKKRERISFQGPTGLIGTTGRNPQTSG